MLSSYAFQCFHPPLLPPSLSKIRVQTSPTHFSFNGIFQSNFKLTNKKWKFSCFRHEGFSPETPKSEYIDHFLPEETEQPEFDKSSARKRNWKSSLQQAADAVSRAVGKRWNVPWTVETIVQMLSLLFDGLYRNKHCYASLGSCILVHWVLDNSFCCSHGWVEQGISNIQGTGLVQPCDGRK
ncbi:uncharacterized protein LOC120123651 isoform X2 [Hibiscus syriacus]|uniref:uncharacterized protein LOC120123651 isoform X2 n=1 Tax=Hibiscus syriacus TaxID=106335 RepID=UPI0019236A8D|nr:uncharacterized protein LOC120123651 isoform X2 [Hibiscus syriacus]